MKRAPEILLAWRVRSVGSPWGIGASRISILEGFRSGDGTVRSETGEFFGVEIPLVGPYLRWRVMNEFQPAEGVGESKQVNTIPDE